MFSRFREYLILPQRDKQHDIHQAKLVRSVSLGVVAIAIISGLVDIAFLPASLPYLISSIVVFLIFLVSYFLARRGLVHGAGLFLIVSIWIITTYINFFVEASGVFGFCGYIIVLILANLLFNARVGLFFFVLIIAINIGALIVDVTGIVEFNYQSASGQASPAAYWVAQTALFFFFALLLRLAFKALQEAIVRAQSKEQQLARRVVQIKTAAEVSRDATSVREMDQLLGRAVDLICERFGFYYAAIYLVDDSGEYAVLKSAKGEAGHELLKRGYKLRVGREGMIGFVAETGQPHVVVDVEDDAVHYKNPLLPHTRSEMSLPLLVKERILGVLDVQSQKEGAFTEEDVEVLQTMADQLAVAYETARLFEAAHRQLRELTVLHTVALSVTQLVSEDSLIERVTQIIGDAFYPDNFGIIQVDVVKGMLRKHPSYRERVEDDNIPYPIGSGVTGMVAKEGKSWRVNDTSKELLYVAVDPGTCSELCVPIKLGERVVGVLNTESTQLNAYTEADERLLSTVAGHLALALENARLFEAEHRMSEDLESLRQAGLHLTSSLELKPVLETTLDQVIRLVKADYARIYVVEAEYSQPNAPVVFGAESFCEGNNKRIQKVKSSIATCLDEMSLLVIQNHQKLILYNLIDSPWYQKYNIEGSIICLPLQVGEQLMGVVELFFATPNAFDRNDLRILELLFDQAALAIANARLFADVQSHTKELLNAVSLLREMDQKKNEFIQNVSHELRTPLAVVLGYGELLESGELGDLKPEQLGPVSIIVRRLRGLSMILEDFLIILDVETYDQPFDLVDLAKLLYKTLADSEGSIARAGVRLEVEIDPDLLKTYGISSHLRRVIENLLGNALKFTPANGLIKVTLKGSGNEVILEIDDTGIGISPEQLPRVFERFYQVDGTSTRRYGGVGLGLALVKEVVEAHGGNVNVESQVGKGSSFRVTLPIEGEVKGYNTSTKKYNK